jgi:lipoate-protein ligase A
MINSILLYESRCFDPYRNLAVEQVLLESVKEGQCILYLWQNENTVVIGRNQNPWKECATSLLEEEGGKLARRLSGGGAVFHDLGNLNFTFLLPQGDFDTERQLKVIQTALKSFGIDTEISGRNDLTANAQKFSGNAYYKNGVQAYHHGTLLVIADMSKLSRYLTPSKAKLQSKGVDSVRSRVVNLKELNPEITIEGLKAALAEAFSKVYGVPSNTLMESELDQNRIAELTCRNRSWEWNFGQKMPFTMECQDRFPWGSIQIQLEIQHGLIHSAQVWTDAMDFRLAPKIQQALTGCAFTKDALSERLTNEPDILQLLLSNL